MTVPDETERIMNCQSPLSRRPFKNPKERRQNVQGRTFSF